MTSIADFISALGRCYFTADAVTAINQELFNMMEDISIITNSGFKTMLKIMQERTTVTTQDSAGSNAVVNAPVVVSV